MPYIISSARRRLNAIADVPIPDNAGELNYLVTALTLSYLARHGKKYQTMNDIVGVLESAKHEFQRRIVDPYEDQKIAENGDVL